MGKKKKIIKEAIKRGFVMGAVHSGLSGGRFTIVHDLELIFGALYGGDTGCIYCDGHWATIIPEEKKKPIFTTEDGVDVFNADVYYYIYGDGTIKKCVAQLSEQYSEWIVRFSTKQAAKDWIERQQQPKVTDQARCGRILTGTIRELLSTPKSIKPEELVDGGIYVDEYKPNCTNTFRAGKDHRDGMSSVYSLLNNETGRFSQIGYLHYDNSIRPATLLEKQKLITEEVKNNYFHELRNQK